MGVTQEHVSRVRGRWAKEGLESLYERRRAGFGSQTKSLSLKSLNQCVAVVPSEIEGQISLRSPEAPRTDPNQRVDIGKSVQG